MKSILQQSRLVTTSRKSSTANFEQGGRNTSPDPNPATDTVPMTTIDPFHRSGALHAFTKNFA
jgi:hypothetical protein